MQQEPEVQNSEDMLPAERRQRILDWFDANVAASNQELARLVGASISTIRRDLDQLDSQGLVRRTHGGAVRARRKAAFEPTTDQARQTAMEEKRAIAEAAAGLLEPEMSILVDTGSTLHQFAQVVAGLTLPLTVITSDLFVAGTLANKGHIRLIVPGGHCRAGAFTLLGEPGLSFLKDIRCDRFFLCSQAIDSECVSDTSWELVQAKRAMIEAAASTVLMADSSRFGARALYRVASMERVDTILTDDGLDEEERQRFLDRGANLVTVPVPEA
ncbi:DeoR/GlpR family DNA-binding transcription regulator [Rhizobiaceae bacterium BDR2-2]|uniref:DeoR/GlpR family DNA-binding transcription regulator n=1 Tax=Ectorhizobium quercum TaxID=2965071 RepID=A0AAE3N0W6_9HYPH|nr:DeoR/GlpR family DNA-binding transcription regulator [Ectorhizobium quercum]MCX8997260.1 DeoR/GlpR family DNA-binding transcription regulator [Ectorhizobium quercum]